MSEGFVSFVNKNMWFRGTSHQPVTPWKATTKRAASWLQFWVTLSVACWGVYWCSTLTPTLAAVTPLSNRTLSLFQATVYPTKQVPAFLAAKCGHVITHGLWDTERCSVGVRKHAFLSPVLTFLWPGCGCNGWNSSSHFGPDNHLWAESMHWEATRQKGTRSLTSWHARRTLGYKKEDYLV